MSEVVSRQPADDARLPAPHRDRGAAERLARRRDHPGRRRPAPPRGARAPGRARHAARRPGPVVRVPPAPPGAVARRAQAPHATGPARAPCAGGTLVRRARRGAPRPSPRAARRGLGAGRGRARPTLAEPPRPGGGRGAPRSWWTGSRRRSWPGTPSSRWHWPGSCSTPARMPARTRSSRWPTAWPGACLRIALIASRSAPRPPTCTGRDRGATCARRSPRRGRCSTIRGTEP